MKKNYIDLCDNIINTCIKTRHELGISQGELATYTSLTKASIIDWENGKLSLPFEKVIEITQELNIDINLDSYPDDAIVISIYDYETEFVLCDRHSLLEFRFQNKFDDGFWNSQHYLNFSSRRVSNIKKKMKDWLTKNHPQLV